MLVIALLITLIAAPVLAQATTNDVAAYSALIQTPAGGLAPIATSTILDQRQQGAALAVRYGYIATNGSVGFNNLGATAVLPFGLQSTVSLTGGTLIPSCHDSGDACSPGLMLGAGGDTRLTSFRVAAGVRGSLSLNGELGYAKPRDVDYELSGSVGVPFALLIGATAPGMRIVPFITPAFGFGTEKVSLTNPGFGGTFSETRSDQRFMIGGGVALTNPASTIVANLGFQHVMIDGAKTQVGIAITFGR